MPMKSKTVSIKIIINQLCFPKKSYSSLQRLKKERLFLFDNKLIKNIADPCNAKEHYESFLRKKNNHK